jgi:HEAT repeat protein
MLVSRIPLSGAYPPISHEGIRELASREDAGALDELAEAAAVEDQFLRRTAIEVIGRHPQGRELRAIILSALGDPSGYVVRTACEVVAQWELREAHEPVVALLGDALKPSDRPLFVLWVLSGLMPIFL